MSGMPFTGNATGKLSHNLLRLTTKKLSKVPKLLAFCHWFSPKGSVIRRHISRHDVIVFHEPSCLQYSHVFTAAMMSFYTAQHQSQMTQRRSQAANTLSQRTSQLHYALKSLRSYGITEFKCLWIVISAAGSDDPRGRTHTEKQIITTHNSNNPHKEDIRSDENPLIIRPRCSNCQWL